jgi:uncharacterized SAM-binding protein YcdF (DUF218 family)
MKAKIKYSAIIILSLIIIFSFVNREIILSQIGRFLFVEMKPQKSDVIVILRGDKNYNRTIEAINLFKKGFANTILLPQSLEDIYLKKIKECSIKIPTRQEQLASILIQCGIPKKNLILDNQVPGGGTEGELKRIKNVAKQRGYSKIIIVTSWYHTRRVFAIAKKLFKDNKKDVLIIAAKDDISSPANWWKYRYVAIEVLEEFPKLFIFYLSPFFKITFQDDPRVALIKINGLI